MELESSGGEKIKIESGQKVEVGRKENFCLFSDDLTISRTHISLELRSPGANGKNGGQRDEETMVSFRVLGRNPVCVIRGDGGEGDSPSETPRPTFFKKSESGCLRIGDKISFSVKNPKFFLLKGGACEEEEKRIAEAVERRKRITEARRKRERENGMRKILSKNEKEADGENVENLEMQSFDTSTIDPVKEFGFLVIGHEFDGYKSKLRDISKWNWYIDDAGDSSDDDEDLEEVPKRRKGGMKKKRADDNNDEDWAGEGDDKKESSSKLGNGKRPRTRSTSFQEPAKASRSSGGKKNFKSQKTSDYDDEEDESLGGFIVNDDELEEEEEENEEEEDFDDEEEED
ncbi:unnamed protein product [Victoria cruziana]